MRKFLTLGIAVMLFAACSGDYYENAFLKDSPANINPSALEPEKSNDIIEEEEEEVFTGPFSRLTGLPIDGDNYNRRPMAVVINNSRRAQPQSGIKYADIIYEVLAEGDVTRLVGIFQSYLPDKIGPVRSARDYFVDFAVNHDALFVHHGGSPSGYARTRNLNVVNIDGMAFEGTVFWRDRTYPDWGHNTGTRPLEHSSFTGGYQLNNHVYNRDIRNYMDTSTSFEFLFDSWPSEIRRPARGNNSGFTDRFRVPFSGNYFRDFIYDESIGMFLVENRDGPTRDAESGVQVSVSNVIIKFTGMRVIDAEGRREVSTVGEGTGYLVNGRVYRPIRWARDSHAGPTRWYAEDGSRLLLAPGRTWICVLQNTATVEFEYGENELYG